jgi:hypothetical protein
MPILRRERRLRTRGFRQVLILCLEFGDGFENGISTLPNQFANCAGQDDAFAGSGAARLNRVAVHQEAVAAEQVSAGARLTPQNVSTVTERIERRPDNGSAALRDSAGVRDGLHRGSVLAVVESGIAHARGLAISQQCTGFLSVDPP